MRPESDGAKVTLIFYSSTVDVFKLQPVNQCVSCVHERV